MMNKKIEKTLKQLVDNYSEALFNDIIDPYMQKSKHNAQQVAKLYIELTESGHFELWDKIWNYIKNPNDVKAYNYYSDLAFDACPDPDCGKMPQERDGKQMVNVLIRDGMILGFKCIHCRAIMIPKNWDKNTEVRVDIRAG